MCRSIKVLRTPEAPATRDEIAAAALQFVRKVSGYRKPSRANQAAFDGAVVEVADSVERLLDFLRTTAPAPRPAQTASPEPTPSSPPAT
jgi:hypothetical protein